MLRPNGLGVFLPEQLDGVGAERLLTDEPGGPVAETAPISCRLCEYSSLVPEPVNTPLSWPCVATPR